MLGTGVHGCVLIPPEAFSIACEQFRSSVAGSMQKKRNKIENASGNLKAIEKEDDSFWPSGLMQK